MREVSIGIGGVSMSDEELLNHVGLDIDSMQEEISKLKDTHEDDALLMEMLSDLEVKQELFNNLLESLDKGSK